MNYRIEKSMAVIRNLPKHLRATHAIEGSAAKDYTVNRCLKAIESIQRTTRADLDKVKRDALVEAWNIYLELQSFEGSERQDYNSRRTVSLDDRNGDGLHEHGILQLEPERAVDSDGPDLRSGGLGYRAVNWNSTYFDPKHTDDNHLGSYWRPTKAKPCLVYTKEQIAGLNDGSLHYGDIEGSFEQIHS